MNDASLVDCPVVLETTLPDLPLFRRGKVRDVYEFHDRLLIVTTDRISAYDCVLPTGIPGKGRVLNQLSAFWFQRLADVCPNHLLTAQPIQIEASLRGALCDVPSFLLDGRAMLVKKTEAYPVECVVRGYLDGSGWREYRSSGEVCGIALPAGLRQGSRLPEPIFTPATKSHEGHDINIPFSEMEKLVPPDEARALREISLALYTAASAHAAERGILIADTKFEFGRLQGNAILIDEALTPDSSRFWAVDTWRPGGPQPSFDKQFVRDWLDSSGWDHTPPAPPLPDSVSLGTARRYQEIFDRLTG